MRHTNDTSGGRGPQKSAEEFSDEEIERRARDAIIRSFQTPYKPQKELVGKTARAQARKRKAVVKGSPESP